MLSESEMQCSNSVALNLVEGRTTVQKTIYGQLKNIIITLLG
jgi:hypothetical protein